MRVLYRLWKGQLSLLRGLKSIRSKLYLGLQRLRKTERGHRNRVCVPPSPYPEGFWFLPIPAALPQFVKASSSWI